MSLIRRTSLPEGPSIPLATGRVRIESYLPSNARALRIDLLSWCFWLVAATLAETLASTSHIIYPRRIAAALLWLLCLQLAARFAIHRYWPWASPRSNRFVCAAGVGFAVSLYGFGIATSTHLLPTIALGAGSVIAVASQLLRRRRWWRRAERAFAREVGML